MENAELISLEFQLSEVKLFLEGAHKLMNISGIFYYY